MKPLIFGIGGEKGSGKDTVASMINYIIHAGLTNANYNEWLIKQKSYDLTNGDRVIHSADDLKDITSTLYRIPREYCDDRVKKDEEWFVLSEKRFIDEHQATASIYHKITIENLEHCTLASILSIVDNKKNIIKLRTLLQYIGTNIIRNQLYHSIWIENTISRAVEIAEKRRICIIADVRFADEVSIIKGNKYYGALIGLTRGESNANHSSETIDFEFPYNIENNGSKLSLFYSVVHILQKVL